jgi:protein TonB
VKESVPALDEAAVETVKQWKFKPARAAGKPVSRWVDVPVKYDL